MAVYEFAELRVQMNNRLGYVEKLCQDYLSPDQVSKADLSVCVSNEQFAEEKALSAGFSDGYIESICIYRNLCLKLPKYGRFLLHAAVLDYLGEGYAFLGRSGAGKSTHSALWLKYLQSAKMVNGDKPILRVDGEKVVAYGTPWMGKESRGENTKTTLKALCFIEQAKTNEIVRLTKTATVKRIFSQILLPKDEENLAKTLELVNVLVENTPAYLLRCDISKTAFLTSFEMMTGRRYEEEKNED